jgi:hypothetical protein
MTLPLCTRYFESDERGTYLGRTRGLRLEKYGLKLRRVILIAIRLLLRQLSVTYGNRMSKIDQLFVVGGGFLAVRRIADDQ